MNCFVVWFGSGLVLTVPVPSRLTCRFEQTLW
jgi:hypothetical protein